MTKTDFAKGAAALIVGFATNSVVKEIIKNNTSPDKVADKAAIVIAGYVLGAIAADASKNWTDAKIDELVDWWTTKVKGELLK
jgi:hypothetical protein